MTEREITGELEIGPRIDGHLVFGEFVPCSGEGCVHADHRAPPGSIYYVVATGPCSITVSAEKPKPATYRSFGELREAQYGEDLHD